MTIRYWKWRSESRQGIAQNWSRKIRQLSSPFNTGRPRRITRAVRMGHHIVGFEQRRSPGHSIAGMARA